MSWSNISFVILVVLIVILAGVTQCQHENNRRLMAEIEQADAKAQDLQAQLSEATAQRDAERRRIIETARRLDEALTQFVNNSEEAHDEHEERMEELSHIESPEAVDWLCEPVPDDIRRLLGCETGTGDGTGSEAGSTDGIDAAVH